MTEESPLYEIEPIEVEHVEDDDGAHFQAIVAPTQSGIRLHGDSGVRITLDVDESFMGDALKLVMWRDGVLDVRIRPGIVSKGDSWAVS